VPNLTAALRALLAHTGDLRSVTRTSSEVTLAVELERDDLDGFWLAYCPTLPGAASQGGTIDAAVASLMDAVDGVLRSALAERFGEIETDVVAEKPSPDTRAMKVTISAADPVAS
jgi:predicted RNase H-like HicB family nuclease